jgi:hypothetical protein
MIIAKPYDLKPGTLVQYLGNQHLIRHIGLVCGLVGYWSVSTSYATSIFITIDELRRESTVILSVPE